MRLKDKVAIITGAAQSQGRGATLLFCKEGAKVVAVDWNLEGVTETVRRAKAMGGDAIVSHTDIRKEAEVEKVVKLAVDTYGKLNVLYNNAAVDPFSGPITQISEKTLDFVLGVNLKGYFLFCKHAIPEMIKAGGGSIINIASNAVLVGGTGDDAYTTAKSGLLGLSKSIAAQFIAQNVRCNVILPGGIYSEGHKFLFEHPEKLEAISEMYRAFVGPIERFGIPEDIVYCAIWLASDESTYCTGAEIVIDGAESIARHYIKGDMLHLFREPSRPSIVWPQSE